MTVDPQLKAKQKKANMAKKQVLMKKMQAVRMGAGDQIMASKEADGDLVDEGMLVNVAKGVESGVKKFNKFDDKVTKSIQKKVVKPAVKNVKKVAKKTGMAVLRGTAGAVGGAIKGAGQGAMKGIKKGLREEDMMKPEMDAKPKSKKEKKEEDDPRSMPTKISLAKNKMRAMGLNMGYQHDQGLVDAYQKVYEKGEQIDEILEKGTKGRVEFHSGRSDKENRQVMKTKRKTVNNPKGRKIHQSPMGKTIGKLNQVKSKQYDAEKKGDTKTASKMMDRRSKLSGTLYDKTGKFYDRADND